MPEKKKTAAAAPAVEGRAAEGLPERPRSLRPVNLPRPLHAAAVPRLHRSCMWSSAASSIT